MENEPKKDLGTEEETARDRFQEDNKETDRDSTLEPWK